MKVLLDTDVLMDVALGRAKSGTDSSALLEWCQRTPDATVVAWHTISYLFYLLSAARSPAFAREFLSGLLTFATVASGTTESVRYVLTMRMQNFEDALQVEAAISAEASFIVTRNIADHRASPVPALTPSAVLKRFKLER